MEAKQNTKKKYLVPLFSIISVIIVIFLVFFFTQKRQFNQADNPSDEVNNLYQKDNVVDEDGFFQKSEAEALEGEELEAEEAEKKAEGEQSIITSNAGKDKQEVAPTIQADSAVSRQPISNGQESAASSNTEDDRGNAGTSNKPGNSQGNKTPEKPGGGDTDNPSVIPVVSKLPSMSNQLNLGWTQGVYGGAANKSSNGQVQPSGEKLEILGMQVRTVLPMGMRFVAQIDRSFQEDLEKKGQVEYGILLIEKEALGDSELTLDGKYNTDTANKTVSPTVIRAEKDLFYDENSRIFTAVISNISPQNYDNYIAARSYVKVLDTSGRVVEIHYSLATLEGSVESIALEAINNPGTVVKEDVEDQQWLRVHVLGEKNTLPPQQQMTEFYLNGEEQVELYLIDQNNQAQLVDGFNQAQFDQSKYRVKVITKTGKAIYANIKKLEEMEGKVGFWLDLEGYKTYLNARLLDGAFVFYGEKEEKSNRVIPFIRPLQELIDIISDDLSGNYILKKDYDASGFSGSIAAILGSFTGTLDGAGHKIHGLSIPLFEKMDGAAVSNLILDTASIQRGAESEVGILSKRADNSHIINVHVQGSVTSSSNRIGGLLGVADKNTSIERSSARVTVQGGNGAVGGLVGAIWDTEIANCYAIGTVYGTLNNASSQGVGGLVGWISKGGVISTSYACASVSTNVSHGGGLIGTIPNDAGFQGTSLINNISFSTKGNGYKFLGKLTNRIFSIPEIKGNIFIEGGELQSDFTRTDVVGDYTGKIEERALNEVLYPDFYVNSLGFNEAVWDLSPLSGNRTPVLVGIDPGMGALLTEEGNGIAKEGISEDIYEEEGFEQKKEILYYNLSLLMPYAYAKDIVKTAQGMDIDHVLNQYKIKAAHPVDEQGNRVVSLEKNEAEKLTNLYLHFTEEAARPLLMNITFLGIKNDVAAYQIDRFPIVYQFAKPVIDTDSAAFQTLLTTAKEYQYEVDQSAADSSRFIEGRTASLDQDTVRESYKRNYTERVKPNLEECLVSYLSTRSDLPINTDSPADISVLEKELVDSGKLLDFLFAYNYTDRWYDITIGGINLRDVVLFDASVVNGKREGLLEDYSTLLKTGEGVRSGRGTNNFYKNYLSQQAELTQGKHDVAAFVEYFMAEYAGYSDVNDWIVENFQGLIVEAKAKNPKISYRLWKLLKNNTVFSNQELVLPTLSYKTSRNLYLASFPTSIAYGNLEVYSGYSDTESFREKKRKELEQQLADLTSIYDNFVNLAENGASSVNASKFLIVDTSYKKNHNQDVFKEFYKPLQTIWSLNSGAVAIVFGTPTRDYIYYNSNTFIGDSQTLAHEMGHVTDMWIWLENKGKRPLVYTSGIRNGEDYSNGFTNQAVLDYNMNFMKEYGRDSNIMSNLTPERISNPEGFKSFYKEVFETIYTLDYLQGMAYLQLTPEQQARITLKHNYAVKKGQWNYNITPNNTMVSTWTRVSDTQLENMKLKTLDDLWDNQLTIRPGHRHDLVSSNLVGSNDLGSYNLDRVSYASWYVPYFNEGSPNAQIFRRNGFELGGLFGYSDGLVAYMSGKTRVGDLAHYRSLFGSDFTFEKYRKEKNQEISQKLQAQKLQENPLFDEEALIEYFKQAMINPGYEIGDVSSKGTSLQNIRDARENVYRYLQRITDDFSSPIYDTGKIEVQYISTAQELIDKANEDPNGFFVLKNDISMEGITVGGNTYINQTFIGKIDGNGYKISGLSKPIFNRVVNSYISNLTLEESNGTVKNSLLARGISMSIQVQEEKSVKEIGSLEELQQIGNNAYASYVLTADIDASQADGKVVIPGTFSSVLTGKGHKIYGLKKPLFENISGGKLTDLSISEVSIEKNTQVPNPAVITLRSNKAVFSDINISDIQLKGKDYAGVVTGMDRQGSTFLRIQIQNARVEAEGSNAGVFAGRVVNSQIEDVAVIGSRISVARKESGSFVGSSIGTDISHVYSQVELTVNSHAQEEANQIGGFIGVLGNASAINQVISEAELRAGEAAVDLTSIPRFVGKAEDNIRVVQAYEYETANGQSQAGVTFGEELKPLLAADKKEPDFYRNLGFAEDIWNLSHVELKGYPELRGMEQGQVYTVGTWEELLRLEAYPNDSFVLAADLNASGMETKEVIIQEFAGSLDGNGYSIAGLNVPLFGKLTGEVKNLKLQDSQFTTRVGQEEGLLAGSLENARVTNLLLQDVHLTSAEGAGLLAGSSTGSHIENILVINSSMQAASAKGSGFLLKAFDTTMRNIWQKVDVQKEGGEAASFLQEDLGQNAIEGVVLVGNLPEDTEKFLTGASSTIGKVYVFSESTGISVSGIGIEVIGQELWNQEFYSRTLGLSSSDWDFSRVSVLGYPVLKAIKNTQDLATFTIPLSTVESLETLSRLPDGAFVLTKDISLASQQSVLVPGTFTGKLDGAGYTLSDLQAPLFEDLRGEIDNLHVENAFIANTEGGANLLAKTAQGAKVTDVFFYGITLQGKAGSGIVGSDQSSAYDRVGIRGLTLNLGGGNSGSLMGEAAGTSMTNIFTSDIYVKSEKLQTNWEFVGGLVGKVSSVQMKDIYSENYLELPIGESSPNTSALIGGMGNTASVIQNVVSAGGILPHDPIHNKDKFVYLTDIQSSNLTGVTNCYINESTGGRNLAAGGITEETQATLESSAFYQNIFDTQIWNLQTLPSLGMPTLSRMKNIRVIPPNSGLVQEDYGTPLLQENVPDGYVGITNANDLLQLKTNPNGKYILMADISVYGLHAAESFLGNFAGELEGNGQVIADVHDAPLFETLSGKVKNLTLKDARVEKYELSKGASVLAKQIRGGVVEKVKLESVHLSGGSYTGALAGEVSQKSKISEIWAEDLVVNEVGPAFDPYVQKNLIHVGGLIGRMEDSSVTYVYASGEITLSGHKQGGVIGSIVHDLSTNSYSKVEQVIADMTVKSTLPLQENWIIYNRGGLVGEVNSGYGNKWIKNSLAMGEAKENSAVGSLYPSFIFMSNRTSMDGLENCYEVQGAGQASASYSMKVITQEGLTKDFYQNTLGLDSSLWDFSTVENAGVPTLYFLEGGTSGAVKIFSALLEEEIDETVSGNDVAGAVSGNSTHSRWDGSSEDIE